MLLRSVISLFLPSILLYTVYVDKPWPVDTISGMSDALSRGISKADIVPPKEPLRASSAQRRPGRTRSPLPRQDVAELLRECTGRGYAGYLRD